VTHVVVVGAGTAGCVVVRRLSERPDHTVTVLEAGPDGGGAAVTGASYLDALAAPGRMWEGSYPQGRGVGGSSAINGMLAGAPDAAELARLGLSEFDPATLMPAAPAGDDELGPLDRALLAAMPDAVRVPLTRRAGVRHGVADVYLAPARDRPNLDVRTDAEVVRLVIRGRRCVGVELTGAEQVAADTVIVAAGAIRTPALLRRSGLDDPAIGDGLLDHPSIALTVELRPDAVPDPHSLVTATAWRGGELEVLPMNHLGPATPGFGVMMAALMRPEGRGRVVVADDPSREPVVEMVWSESDRARLAGAERELRRMVRRPPFAEVVVSAAADAHPGAYVHACGSCHGVLDADGAVRGVDGLYVCDASALPALPATGTMLVTVAWAERFARRLP
jgi:choline dehydrogenase